MTCANIDSGRSCNALTDAGIEVLVGIDSDVVTLVKVEMGMNTSVGSTPGCTSHCSSQGWGYSLCGSGSCYCSACMTCSNHDSGRSCNALADAGSEVLVGVDSDVVTLVKVEMGMNASVGSTPGCTSHCSSQG